MHILVYDETAQKYVISPDYISSVTGSYASTDTWGLFLEGSSAGVDGSWLGSSGQYFTNIQYWDAAGTYYHWVNTPYAYKTNGVPNNIDMLVFYMLRYL